MLVVLSRIVLSRNPCPVNRKHTPIAKPSRIPEAPDVIADVPGAGASVAVDIAAMESGVRAPYQFAKPARMEFTMAQRIMCGHSLLRTGLEPHTLVCNHLLYWPLYEVEPWQPGNQAPHMQQLRPIL